MLWQPPKDRAIYNLDVAYGIVRERLAGVDMQEQCRRSRAELQADGSVLLRYLNQTYRLDIQKPDAAPVDATQPISLRDKILLLHYFSRAAGTPSTGKQVTYRDLPGGLVYYPTFMKRTIQPLTDAFGKDGQLLLRAGQTLNARQGEHGDASLIVTAFPRVDITLLLWQGDEELQGEVNLLFDANITDYLESEDVTVVCETITWRLVRAAKSPSA